MYICVISRGYPSDAYKMNGIFEYDQAKALAASQVSMVPYLVAGAIYWVFNLVVEMVLTRVEKKLNYYHD